MNLGENLDGIYQELVHFNHATVQGEALHDQRGERDAGEPLFNPATTKVGEAPLFQSQIDDSILSLPPSAAPASEPVPSVSNGTKQSDVIPTLRGLMDDYFKRDGGGTGSDDQTNIRRAVRLFEDLCPQVQTMLVPEIPLRLWDELYEFVQFIPLQRGTKSPENLVAFTREKLALGTPIHDLGQQHSTPITWARSPG
ncbi:hypothetical protein SAMN04487974_109154 [Pelagibacterium luteolum]|uniref:Uncharacterized protein n=1 Tax=Pelagibacterium luteolum TaxID=440168 RepID=A0A1G7XJJ7_9HYPH|nr:hypothetical protein SAMN04487974_109154 [Pelagibacterium luteolum]